jgi:hypothetical protein
MVLADPDDLFLPANPPMVVAVPARPFTDGKTVFQDPGEVPGGDPQRPLSS